MSKNIGYITGGIVLTLLIVSSIIILKNPQDDMMTGMVSWSEYKFNGISPKGEPGKYGDLRYLEYDLGEGKTMRLYSTSTSYLQSGKYTKAVLNYGNGNQREYFSATNHDGYVQFDAQREIIGNENQNTDTSQRVYISTGNNPKTPDGATDEQSLQKTVTREITKSSDVTEPGTAAHEGYVNDRMQAQTTDTVKTGENTQNQGDGTKTNKEQTYSPAHVGYNRQAAQTTTYTEQSSKAGPGLIESGDPKQNTDIKPPEKVSGTDSSWKPEGWEKWPGGWYGQLGTDENDNPTFFAVKEDETIAVSQDGNLWKNDGLGWYKTNLKYPGEGDKATYTNPATHDQYEYSISTDKEVLIKEGKRYEIKLGKDGYLGYNADNTYKYDSNTGRWVKTDGKIVTEGGKSYLETTTADGNKRRTDISSGESSVFMNNGWVKEATTPQTAATQINTLSNDKIKEWAEAYKSGTTTESGVDGWDLTINDNTGVVLASQINDKKQSFSIYAPTTDGYTTLGEEGKQVFSSVYTEDPHGVLRAQTEGSADVNFYTPETYNDGVPVYAKETDSHTLAGGAFSQDQNYFTYGGESNNLLRYYSNGMVSDNPAEGEKPKFYRVTNGQSVTEFRCSGTNCYDKAGRKLVLDEKGNVKSVEAAPWQTSLLRRDAHYRFQKGYERFVSWMGEVIPVCRQWMKATPENMIVTQPDEYGNVLVVASVQGQKTLAKLECTEEQDCIDATSICKTSSCTCQSNFCINDEKTINVYRYVLEWQVNAAEDPIKFIPYTVEINCVDPENPNTCSTGEDHDLFSEWLEVSVENRTLEEAHRINENAKMQDSTKDYDKICLRFKKGIKISGKTYRKVCNDIHLVNGVDNAPTGYVDPADILEDDGSNSDSGGDEVNIDTGSEGSDSSSGSVEIGEEGFHENNL